MTATDRKKLDNALGTFKKFSDFVKFSYDHDIIFYHDEWVEYRDKVMKRVGNGNAEISDVDVDTDGLVLPV